MQHLQTQTQWVVRLKKLKNPEMLSKTNFLIFPASRVKSQTGFLVSLYKIASKGLNVEILQILFLKPLYFFYLLLCLCSTVFTGLFSEVLKIWHF